MKISFIFNPHSGRHGRNARLLPLLREFISERGLDADFAATAGPGHATILARKAVAAGCARVVAIGGDGTMNEVAQALVHTPAALGLVPCGSGNGLARHLGLPGSHRKALELVADPEAGACAIDAGVANGRLFFNAMGFGLDAEVSRAFNLLKKRGLPAYARTGFAAFIRRHSQHCVLTAGDRRQALEILLLTIANSDQYGNGAVVAPGARADDGELDLVAVPPVGLVSAGFLAARLFLGNLDRSPKIFRLRGAHFLIERSAPGLIHTDGECHSTSAAVEVKVLPHSLRVITPIVKTRSKP